MEIPGKRRGEKRRNHERDRKKNEADTFDAIRRDGRHMSSASNILGNITDFKIDEIKTVKDPRLLCIEVIRVKKIDFSEISHLNSHL